MTDVETSISSDAKLKKATDKNTRTKGKPKAPRASKRGANEDSEVRYDTKHALKKQKNGKGEVADKKCGRKKKIDEVTEIKDGNADADDGANSVVSGNEDDRGSVVSAILDEDICYQCGLCTLDDPDNWNNVVMCDMCDGEYHLKCQGLKCIPEGSFVCSRCKRDEEFYKDYRFEVSDSFKIPERPQEERSIVYSPAKPLALAWEECVQKGLMVVSNVLSHDIMSQLTHGVVQKVLRSGRVAEQWLGATKEVAKRVNSTACHDIIDRNGRYDLRLPDYVIAQLGLDAALEPILTRLASIMGSPKPQVRTQNVIFVPVGSGIQEWHVDDSMVQRKTHRYFTVLINLNPLDAYCGGTEVWIDKLKRGDLIRARPGDALVFHGSLLHRGHANNGYMHRFFYYASFSCGADANTGNT